MFWNFGLLGCFNSMGRSINTLMIYLSFVGDVWIVSDYLFVMLLKYGGEY